MGQGAKPGIGGHLPGVKIGGDISRTRMIPEGSDDVVRSARNIQGIQTAGVHTLNVYDILRHESFVMTKDMAKAIEEVYAQ